MQVMHPENPLSPHAARLPAALLSLLALLPASLILAACGGSPRRTLFHAIDCAPYMSLDPSVEQSDGSCVLRNVYETLTVYDDGTGEAVPCLAESWECNAIMTEWTFTLRKDVLFHDGSELTASAVKKSVERTMRLGKGSSYIWDCVSSVEAPDARTVTFVLKYAAPLPLIASSGRAAYIISPAATGRDEAWFNAGNDAGSGPYRIVAASGNSVTMEAFESYRGGWSKGQFRRVFLQEVPDKARRMSYLRTGDADIASFPDEEELARIPGCSLASGKSWRSVIMMFNGSKAPCADKDFRKALAYSFPYGDAVSRSIGGRAALSKGMLPPGMWGHDDSLPSYTLDLEKAGEHLEKSGMRGRTVTISYQAEGEALNEVMEAFRGNLEKIGLLPILLRVDWDSQQKMARNPAPEARQDVLVMDWWPDYPDPAGTFRPLLSGQGPDKGFNFCYLDDARMELALNRAAMQTLNNRDDASRIYGQIQRQVLDECYLVFLYDSAIPVGIKAGLKGVRLNPAYETCLYYYGITR